MIKISDAIGQILRENAFLEFGFSQRIFNLTQLAQFIKPLIEARIQKEVQVPAVVMNLSRFQKTAAFAEAKNIDFKIKNIDIYSNLETATFFKDATIHDRVNDIFAKVRERKGFFGLSESSQEVTVFFPRNFSELVYSSVPNDLVRYKNSEITCVRVRFDEKYFGVPGLLYFLMQKIYLQGINVIEISSTYTELSFYLRKGDVKLAFETLHDSFVI